MSILKNAAVILAMGLSGLAHAERITTWKIEGHITSIDLSADNTYADLWSKFDVGQDYVATFKVDLDDLRGTNGEYTYSHDSNIEFKQAGLTYRLSFVGSGIYVGTGGLDLGYGYGPLQGGGPQDPGIAHAWKFEGAIPSYTSGDPSLADANAAIKAGALALKPIQFGFVGNDLGSLGTFVHASVDKLTTSAVPEVGEVAMVLAGGLPCGVAVAVRRRKRDQFKA